MKAKPKLGQNFLVDPAACASIVDALGDLSGATVVEIGPGAGAITALLAARARRLVAIELDHALAAHLRDDFPAVEIVEADVLTVDLSALRANVDLSISRADEERLRVVGNLPYYITSPILMHLFAHSGAIATAVVMMQREVADRVSAAPGSRDYGILSVISQMYAEVEHVLTLPPSAFMPPPEVHSTVLRLRMRPRFKELGVSTETFPVFIRQCFAQKRKTLGKNLRGAGFSAEQVTAAMRQAAISPQARAEALAPETLAALWQALHLR